MAALQCYRCSAWPCVCRDGCTLIHGDSHAIAYKLQADVVLTDPPYGIEGGRGGDRRYGKAVYDADWEDTPQYIEEVVVPVIEDLVNRSKRMAITPGLRCWRMYPPEQGTGCFWYPAAVTHGPWGFTCFTPIFYYGFDPRAGIGQLPSGISVIEAAEKNGHPCPKPISAWKWLLHKLAPKDGETILDPFCGSGTTLVAAKQMNRRAIGIEIEEKYVEICAQRLRQEVLNFTEAP